jgi:H/ACA ribonucleoprotein complex subunit 2
MSDDYDVKVKHCAVIAKPLANPKLCKKVLKLCKKATKKKQVKRGVKEVVKAIRKKTKGYVAAMCRLCTRAVSHQ